MRLERAYCEGNREVGLAGAGGAYSEGDGVLAYHLAVFLLTEGLGAYRLARVAYAHAVRGDGVRLGFRAVVHEGYHVAHVLVVYRVALEVHLREGLQTALRGVHGIFVRTGYFHVASAAENRHAERLLYCVHIAVKIAEQRVELLNAFHCE